MSTTTPTSRNRSRMLTAIAQETRALADRLACSTGSVSQQYREAIGDLEEAATAMERNAAVLLGQLG